MERYADGDDAAFEAVYDALAARLYSYLRRCVPDSHRRGLHETEPVLLEELERGTLRFG